MSSCVLLSWTGVRCGADPELRPSMEWVLDELSGLCQAEEERVQQLLEEELPVQERDRLRGHTQTLRELREMMQRLEVQQNVGGAERLAGEE